MTENLGRKTTLTVALLLAAAGLILGKVLVGEAPFRLGLDLKGGTRLVYELPIENNPQLSEEERANPEEVLQEHKGIIHERLDPSGVKEISVRSQGKNQLVIELPGAAEVSGTAVEGTLATELAPDARTLELDGTKAPVVKAFSQNGGTIRIGDELILYAARNGTTLTRLKRGHEGTQPAAHAAGANVELLSSDEIERAIENVGDMQFLLAATPDKLRAVGGDLAAEQTKLDDWRKTHGETPIEEYNEALSKAGGPAADLRWHPHRFKSNEVELPYAQRQMVPLLVARPADPAEPRDAWKFTGNHLSSVGLATDNFGYPAVAFELAPDQKALFGDFTEAHINDGMAIVLNGEIATLANIKSRIPGSGIIEGGAGGFTRQEVKELITVLRSGSLRIKPVLVDKARVGASLGEDYINSSWISGLVATLVVVLFMCFVYRRLGVFAVLGLVANLVLLMGVLSLWGATLTLPGIAGIVLTVGMAVDGNILIFERLREELKRGLKLPQAAKAAFERAAVTIIDSNLTTLIAGIILYWFGSGPIRGFATTICVGILTTLFTVIVVTQVLMFHDIKRGAKPYAMRELIRIQGVNFMGAVRWALPISLVFLIGTVGLFAALPIQKKLGIDFLGGYALTVRTQEPQRVETIRELIATGVTGEFGRSAEVKAISDTREGDGYRAFRIQAKLGEEAAQTASGAPAPADAAAVPAEGDAPAETVASGAQTAERQVRTALKSVLQRGPVEVDLESGPASQLVRGEIYFESSHSAPDVTAALVECGIEEVAAEPLEGSPNTFAFHGRVGASASDPQITSTITRQFTAKLDSTGAPYQLLSPVPESALVGAQVGAGLRDKAIRALLLAMFATVLYLRFRFADWSYGIAVVAALAHDVLFTLGCLALALKLDFVQAEVDLTMIAAFLTIIGYSANDTIVIFDRVREILPRSKKSLREVLNEAINQTMGRTILTSSTVFMTVSVLFLFNVGSRNVIEGLTFALIVGVVSGTYSTIYIAGPVLLWCENFFAKRRAKGGNGGAPQGAELAITRAES